MEDVEKLAFLPREVIEGAQRLLSRLESEHGLPELAAQARLMQSRTIRLYAAQDLTGMYSADHDISFEDMQTVLDETAKALDVGSVRLIQTEWESKTACYFNGKIWLPGHYRNPFVLMHEFCHHIIAEHKGGMDECFNVGHGRQFADVQLIMVREVFGQDQAEGLALAYEIVGVEHSARKPVLAGV